MKKYTFLIAMLLSSTLAYAVNTMPNCGFVPGSEMPNVDVASVPLPLSGSTVPKIKARTTEPAVKVQTPDANGLSLGATRFVVGRAPVVVSFNDPLVYPKNVGASHLHMFYGNVNAGKNGFDINTDLRQNCESGASGGTLNCTAYWMPAFVDVSTNSYVPSSTLLVYYKAPTGGTGATPYAVVPPDGLRMVVGNSKATTEALGLANKDGIAYMCGENLTRYTHIPPCEQGKVLKTEILFQQCWDGVNLDSPDHKSHMNVNVQGSVRVCPATHPVRLPRIALNWFTPITAPEGTANWALSSDNYPKVGYNSGFSLHADWINGWDRPTMEIIVNECLNTHTDCHSQYISPNMLLVE